MLIHLTYILSAPVRLGMQIAFGRVRRKTAPTGPGEMGCQQFGCVLTCVSLDSRLFVLVGFNHWVRGGPDRNSAARIPLISAA